MVPTPSLCSNSYTDEKLALLLGVALIVRRVLPITIVLLRLLRAFEVVLTSPEQARERTPPVEQGLVIQIREHIAEALCSLLTQGYPLINLCPRPVPVPRR